MLRPDLMCIRAFSAMKCMQLIKEDTADMVVLDAGDIYHAGQYVLSHVFLRLNFNFVNA